jgi:hypothetical protein
MVGVGRRMELPRRQRQCAGKMAFAFRRKNSSTDLGIAPALVGLEHGRGRDGLQPCVAAGFHVVQSVTEDGASQAARSFENDERRGSLGRLAIFLHLAPPAPYA